MSFAVFEPAKVETRRDPRERNTMFIRDAVLQALEARLLGASEFHSTCNALDRALVVQFRLQYHTGGDSVITPATGKVLFGDIDKVEMLSRRFPLDKPLLDLINKILGNCAGIIHFSIGEFEDAKVRLQQARDIKLDKTFDVYDMYLGLENLYYTACLRQDEQQISDCLYDHLFDTLSFVPSASEALTHQCLWKIAKRLKGHNNLANLIKIWPENNRALVFLISIIASDNGAYTEFSKDNDEMILKYGMNLVEKIKFPKASENNNYHLEQFMLFLQVYFKNIVPDQAASTEWYNFILKAMSKTFQSINVAHTALFVMKKIGSDNEKGKINGTLLRKEALLNFVNFIRYGNKEFKLNKNYNDIISLLVCYNFVINEFTKKDNIDNLFDYDKSLDELLSLLVFFYKEYNIPLSEKKQSLDILENPIRLAFPPHVANTLSRSWLTLYNYHSTSLSALLSFDLLAFLANCVPISRSMDEGLFISTVFQYALTLAKQRDVETAIKVLEKLILERHPNCYKAWHLMALCHSTKENKETAYKIVCSVLEAMNENMKDLAFEEKFQYIYMKITQLRLIQDMFGTDETLELIPELFELYNTLFLGGADQNKVTINGVYDLDMTLQDIWLYVCSLYMKTPSTDNLLEAETAMDEAMALEKDHWKGRYLPLRAKLNILKQQNKQALLDIEKAIDLDNSNIDAIVCFAELIFDVEKKSEEDLTDEYYKLVPIEGIKECSKNQSESEDRLFFNATDRSAATARLKLLLDSAVAESIEGYYTPEVWWYLSQIHEQFATKDYKLSLMKCIKFEELRPIAQFENCNY